MTLFVFLLQEFKLFILVLIFEEIHQKVIENDKMNSHTSYICQLWFDMYLESRLPLPLNFNPFLTFKRDPQEANNDQVHEKLTHLKNSVTSWIVLLFCMF